MDFRYEKGDKSWENECFCATMYILKLFSLIPLPSLQDFYNPLTLYLDDDVMMVFFEIVASAAV